MSRLCWGAVLANQLPRVQLACERALLFGRASRKRANELRRSLARSRETRFARPNRRACSQAKVQSATQPFLESSRNAPPPQRGGASRDDTKNGCVADYPGLRKNDFIKYTGMVAVLQSINLPFGKTRHVLLTKQLPVKFVSKKMRKRMNRKNKLMLYQVNVQKTQGNKRNWVSHIFNK